MTAATAGPSRYRAYMAGNTDASTEARAPWWLRGGIGVVAVALATMWFVEALDTFLLDDDLQPNGIRPRSVNGLDGIAWSPFLHVGFRHLISNTIPFVVLSGLVLTRGARRYVIVSIVIIALGGALVWLFALSSNSNHIGASGWVFGLFGYLVAAVWFERKPVSILAAGIAVVLYGSTILFGFLPRPGLSWEGHLFGFIAGIIAARLVSGRRSHARAELAP